jgi:hypothetical protein
MSLVNYSNLDFDQIRKNIKDYLRSNSNFTDYDFEGSNLSTIIDVLAYNTYISSFNANMVANEVFIDSSTLRENVVSLARNIGYVPRSKTSSRATITFLVDLRNISGSFPLTLTLKKGPVCTSAGSINGQTFVFISPDDITVPILNGVALFEDITLYEGILLEKKFKVDSFDLNQRFILDNSGVDISTINIFVRDNEQTNSGNNFKIVDNLFESKNNENIAFIQEIEDERYELIFGDGVFGKKLEVNNVVEVSYILTSGEVANGISNFTYIGRIIDNQDSIITRGISLISVREPSFFGQDIESVGSIKKYAPRSYSSQNRAVTLSDYETIISKIYPEAELVTTYGGEDMDPPEFGKVFIAIKPKFSQFVPISIKSNLIKQLRKYSVAGIVPVIVDLKILYIEFTTNVYYNTNKVSSSNLVRNDVFNTVIDYSKSSELNAYGSRFKYSKFQKIIDDSNEAITSNITTVQMRRDFKAELGAFAFYEVCFGNEFQIVSLDGGNIRSSGFTVDGIGGICYFTDLPEDEFFGELILVRYESGAFVDDVLTNVGVVDYIKGEIIINSINITSTLKTTNDAIPSPIIELSAIPASNDIIALQDLYLSLDINQSQINMIPDNIESGSDISGTTYIVSSSYSPNTAIR